MVGARFRQENGETIVEFKLPEHISELKLSQYVDFITATKKIIAAQEGEAGDINPIAAMIDAVTAVSGVDVEQAMRARVGNLYSETAEQMDGSLRNCFGWTSNVITKYEPKKRTEQDCRFTHKGQEFVIPYITTSPLFQRAILPDISTGQAVSAYELMRLSNRAKEKNGDPEGSRMYSDYLELLAILALKDGERLPTATGERMTFIEQRIAFFQDINAETALDVDFFLSNTLMALKATHSIIGFLTLSLFGLAAATLNRKGKHTTTRKPIQKRYSTA